MKDFMTLEDFAEKVEEQADSFQSNIAVMSELDETEEGDTPFIYQAIRVDFRAEDDKYIELAYEDYLDYNIQEGNFDLQDVLDSLDNPTLTLHDEHDANKIDSIIAGEDKDGEADFESPSDLSDEVIDNATITSIYHSDELDKWCVDADLDSELFAELKNETKEGEPSND